MVQITFYNRTPLAAQSAFPQWLMGGTVKNDSIMLLCNHKSFNSHPQMRSKLIGWNSVFLGSWSQGCSAYETRGLPAIILAFKPELTNASKE